MLSRIFIIMAVALMLWFSVMMFTFKGKERTPYRLKSDSIAMLFKIENKVSNSVDNVLNILETDNVSAVFYVQSETAQQNRQLMHTIYRKGHGLGCYSKYEDNINQVELFKNDIINCKNAINSAIGQNPICYLSDNHMDKELQSFVESQGLVVIKSQINTTKMNISSSDELVQNILMLIKPKYMVEMSLNAESNEQNLKTKALPVLIQKIHGMGLNFGRVCYP